MAIPDIKNIKSHLPPFLDLGLTEEAGIGPVTCCTLGLMNTEGVCTGVIETGGVTTDGAILASTIRSSKPGIFNTSSIF